MFHHVSPPKLQGNSAAKCQRAIQYPQCLQSPPALSDSGFFGKNAVETIRNPLF